MKRFFLPTFLAVFIGVALSLCLVPAVRAADPGATITTLAGEVIPNFTFGSTFRSVQSGDWNDPATWGGKIPDPDGNERVIISAGTHVTLSDMNAIAHSVSVYEDGKLSFATNTDTQLKVGNFIILGTLEVGTKDIPIASDVSATIAIRNDIRWDRSKDPNMWGLGVIVAGNAKVSMRGRLLEETFVDLDLAAAKTVNIDGKDVQVGPQAGDLTITLAVDVGTLGWKEDDQLILSGSKQWGDQGTYTKQSERPTIDKISPDGKTLTFTSALKFDHPGAYGVDKNDTRDPKVEVLQFLPRIGNLTHNVAIRSDHHDPGNPNSRNSHFPDEDGLYRRGYFIAMDRADLYVKNAAFVSLGRTTIDPISATNVAGRNPVVFKHLIGPVTPQANGYQYTFEGNSIFCGLPAHDFSWGININKSHYGLVKDNVLFNWSGAGIILSGGNTTGNVIEGNLVVQTDGTGGRMDTSWGNTGSGIWTNSIRNYIRNNVVADGNVYGYSIISSTKTKIPVKQGDDPLVAGQFIEVEMHKMGILEFSGNEAYGVQDGMEIWYIGTNSDGGVYNDVAPSTIQSMRLWNIRRYGHLGYGTENFIFDDWVQRGDKNLHYVSGNLGIWFGDYLGRNITISDADIQGLGTGIRPTPKPGNINDTGFEGNEGKFIIENSFLRNRINIYTDMLRGVTGGGTSVSPRDVRVNNVKFDYLDGIRVRANDAHHNISKTFYPSGANPNIIQNDRFIVTDYNGVVGDNFEVFSFLQGPDYIVPQTYSRLTASPDSGLTNQENWVKNGIAIHGAVAPCRDTIAGVNGYVCGIPPGSTLVLDTAPRQFDINSQFMHREGEDTVDAVISWYTTKPSTSTITEYRGRFTVDETVATRVHSVTIPGLTPGTRYDYKIQSTNVIGEIVTSKFVKINVPHISKTMDDKPPVLHDRVRFRLIDNATISVFWIALEKSDATLEYSTDPEFKIGVTTFHNPLIFDFYNGRHQFAMTNVQPNTTYYVRATSSDAAGNEMIDTNTVSFDDSLKLTVEHVNDRVVYGDADGNGAFGPEDLNEVVDWLVGNETMPPVGSPAFIAADVDGDGAITPADLNLMVDRLIGKIDRFPVEG